MHKHGGALACARYAFAPNYYHYCGPDTNGEFGEYLSEETADLGLVEHLNRFEVMYPYLKAIAQANGIDDALDPRVVEAYWVGNTLLDAVKEPEVFEALTDKQRLPERIPKDELKWLLPKIDKRAQLHHSFHVFNVFTRTGHHTVEHTVETMDQCRISWGQLMNSKVQSEKLQVHVQTQQLVYQEGQLRLVPATKEVTLPVEKWVKNLQPGDWVSYHWGFVCDVLSVAQVKRLEQYTLHHLKLANETI